MKVKFIPSEEFMRQFKRLAKKYPSLVSDYDTFKKELHENPFQGSDLGSGTRKVRMAIASKGKGKSGGARVIKVNTSPPYTILLPLTGERDVSFWRYGVRCFISVI